MFTCVFLLEEKRAKIKNKFQITKLLSVRPFIMILEVCFKL